MLKNCFGDSRIQHIRLQIQCKYKYQIEATRAASVKKRSDQGHFGDTGSSSSSSPSLKRIGQGRFGQKSRRAGSTRRPPASNDFMFEPARDASAKSRNAQARFGNPQPVWGLRLYTWTIPRSRLHLNPVPPHFTRKEEPKRYSRTPPGPSSWEPKSTPHGS